MTAAAMALSSRTPEPELWLTEVMREARNRPPIAAMVPEIASARGLHPRDTETGAAGCLAAAECVDLPPVVCAAQHDVQAGHHDKGGFRRASGRPWKRLSRYAPVNAITASSPVRATIPRSERYGMPTVLRRRSPW